MYGSKSSQSSLVLVTHHVWCTDGCSVTCDNRYIVQERQIESQNTIIILTDASLNGVNTDRLRRVCIRMVCRVNPSVCSEHRIKDSVTSDHPMI